MQLLFTYLLKILEQILKQILEKIIKQILDSLRYVSKDLNFSILCLYRNPKLLEVLY